jgi:hypothetical protein
MISVVPRLFLEYSFTSAIAVGRHPPSPSPARNLSTPKTSTFGVNAHSNVNTENKVTEKINALRRPMTSVTVPIATAPTIMPTSPTVATALPEPGVSIFCSSNTGNTVPSTTRSNPSSSTAAHPSGNTHLFMRPPRSRRSSPRGSSPPLSSR